MDPRRSTAAWLARRASEFTRKLLCASVAREIRATKQAHLQALIANPAAILKLPAASAEVKGLLFKSGMGPEEALRMFEIKRWEFAEGHVCTI